MLKFYKIKHSLIVISIIMLSFKIIAAPLIKEQFNYNDEYATSDENKTQRLPQLDRAFQILYEADQTFNPDDIIKISLFYSFEKQFRPLLATQHPTHKNYGVLPHVIDDFLFVKNSMPYVPHIKYISDMPKTSEFPTEGHDLSGEMVLDQIRSWTADKKIVILYLNTHGTKEGGAVIPTHTPKCVEIFEQCCKQVMPVVNPLLGTNNQVGDMTNIYTPKGYNLRIKKYEGLNFIKTLKHYKMTPQSEEDWKNSQFNKDWATNHCEGYRHQLNISDFLAALPNKRVIIIKSTCYANTWAPEINSTNPNFEMLVASSPASEVSLKGEFVGSALFIELNDRMHHKRGCELDGNKSSPYGVEDLVLNLGELSHDLSSTKKLPEIEDTYYVLFNGLIELPWLKTKQSPDLLPNFRTTIQPQQHTPPNNRESRDIPFLPVRSYTFNECPKKKDHYLKLVESEKLLLNKVSDLSENEIFESDISDSITDNTSFQDSQAADTISEQRDLVAKEASGGGFLEALSSFFSNFFQAIINLFN